MGCCPHPNEPFYLYGLAKPHDRKGALQESKRGRSSHLSRPSGNLQSGVGGGLVGRGQQAREVLSDGGLAGWRAVPEAGLGEALVIRITSSSGPASQKRSISSSRGGAVGSARSSGLAAPFAEGLVTSSAARPRSWKSRKGLVEAFAEDVVDRRRCLQTRAGSGQGAFGSESLPAFGGRDCTGGRERLFDVIRHLAEEEPGAKCARSARTSGDGRSTRRHRGVRGPSLPGKVSCANPRTRQPRRRRAPPARGTCPCGRSACPAANGPRP